MRRLPCLLFALLLAGAAIFLLTTVDRLPEIVATHFDGSGRPNGWMTRRGYLWFSLGFDIGLPIFVGAMVALLPRAWPRFVNLPNRDYWLARERREASLAFLAGHACWLGCLMVLFGSAVHALILGAHESASPVLASGPLFWMIGAFLAGIGAWIYALYRRFGKPA